MGKEVYTWTQKLNDDIRMRVGFVHSFLRTARSERQTYEVLTWQSARKAGKEWVRMSRREDYEKRTEELLMPIVTKNGIEIYDVEYVKEGSDWYLRAYIDKPEGVNIIDCENVSRELSDVLDKEDFIPDAYILEVSSPGLGRTLKKDKHLEKSIGKEVEVKLFKAVDGSKEFSGILKSFTPQELVITEEDTPRTFQRNEIALIRLALDF